MKYIVREIVYWIIGLRYILKSNHLKKEFRAKIALGSKLEGYNKLSHHSFLSGELGFASYIGDHSVVVGKIGRFCSIAANVHFLTKTHPVTTIVSTHPALYSLKGQSGITFAKRQIFDEEPKLDNEKYPIVVGNDVYIGYGATIIGPVTIGDGAVIAANATVTRDVPPYSIVGGTPAKVIKKRFSEEEIEFLLELKWWNKDRAWLTENAEKFENIDIMMADRDGL